MLTEREFMKLARKHVKKLEKSLIIAANTGFRDGLNGIEQPKPIFCVPDTAIGKLTHAEHELAFAFYKYGLLNVGKIGGE